MTRSTKAGSMPGPAGFLWRALGVCAVALTTANCAQPPQQTLAAPSGSTVDPKYGVKASPRLYNEGETIPKGGGRRFSGKPYVVAGRTYVPREDAKGYVREGLASWYGAAFHGRMTANGEVFDRHSIAAAHPTLPLPSYARVTNLTNQRSMIVRVNDRGPYHAGRVMDVSEEVAQALEFHRSGTSRVRVEYVGKASTAGSDDRKLLATLRTDGRPAAIRGQSPVMLADLGSDAAEPLAGGASAGERLAASRSALAFRPPSEEAPREESQAESNETPEAVRPARPAPVLLARAAGVAVPAALQPTAERETAFKPVAPIRLAASTPPPARESALGSNGAHRGGGRMPAVAQPLTRTAAAWPAPARTGKRSGRGDAAVEAPVRTAASVRTAVRASPVVMVSAKAPPVKAVATARAPIRAPAPPVRLAGAKAAPAPVAKGTAGKSVVATAGVPSAKVSSNKPARARVAEAR